MEARFLRQKPPTSLYAVSQGETRHDAYPTLPPRMRGLLDASSGHERASTCIMRQPVHGVVVPTLIYCISEVAERLTVGFHEVDEVNAFAHDTPKPDRRRVRNAQVPAGVYAVARMLKLKRLGHQAAEHRTD